MKADKIIIGLMLGLFFIGVVGANVITTTLQTADTENLEDTYVESDDANDNFGGRTDLEIQNDTSGTFHRFSYIKFNVSSVLNANSIVGCTLLLYMESEALDVGESVNISIHHSFNQTWNEYNLTYNNRLAGSQINSTPEDNVTFYDGDSAGWYSWNCTNAMKYELNRQNESISFALLPRTAIGTTTPDQIRFTSKEGATSSNRPILNITHTDNVNPLTTISSPLNQTYNNRTILFNVTATDDYMDSCLYSLDSGTTNITMTNVGSAYNATNSSMTLGSHTANFYCNDTSGNMNNTESVTFSVRWGGSLANRIRLNENQGTTAYDISGFANNGTITGATWANDAIDVLLTLNTDYTISGATFTLIHNEFAWSLITATYTIGVSSESATSIEELQSNLTEGTRSIGAVVPNVFKILAVIVVLAVIVLLIVYVRRLREGSGLGNL